LWGRPLAARLGFPKDAGVGKAPVAAPEFDTVARSPDLEAAGSVGTAVETEVIAPDAPRAGPQKIEGMSERIMISHYENNYLGAVKRLNSIADQLATMDYEKTPGFVVNGLKREELIATNSMILHELFFSNLGEQSKPGPTLEAALIRDFSSVERWRSQFTAMGRAEGGGSGWVLLTYSPRDKRLVNAWAADHTTTLAGGVPILAMDMYEHAYQMDFGAKAANYVDVFMKVIRWQTADHLYDQVARA
jgi:Fe-Mn family superoxide dismutase